jgi:uncharacterized repeat protein (TIGR01451 family)
MCHTFSKSISNLGYCEPSIVRRSFTQIAKCVPLYAFAACCIVVGFFGGCKTLSLPAIDPTGNRIFTHQGTTIVAPHDPNNGYPSKQPAFQTPPEPPACMQGGDGAEKKLCNGCLAGKTCLGKRKEAKEVEDLRGRCGQLLLTPTRIVAPVGGEVILLAGICGKDEFLVTNEAIEWMLSPNSVGQIVAVGDDAKGQPRSSWKRDDSPKVEKLDVDFARGRTSKEAGVITRGTSTKADDLPIRKGQTWISLTSPSEGTSKVTALAPDSDVWDKRRQTATIYWVDASWQFPVPQTVISGEEVRLVTRVMKAEGFMPAEGWIVRYRVLNPEFALFMPTKAEKAEVQVDSNGVAQVVIVNGSFPGANQPPFGTVMIEIEVVKPADGALNMPELPIARGTTTVTWSAASLLLQVGGPEIAVPGQPLVYSASLANVGDLVAENTVLTVSIPNGMQFDSASYAPDPQPTNNSVRWTIGPLQARRQFDVSMTFIAAAAMDAQVLFDATGSPNLRQQRAIRIDVLKPQVTLQIAPRQNFAQVEVGNEAAFEILVTNTGNQTINNLEITLASDLGLQHIRGGNESRQAIDFLPPGQPRKLDASFIVQREGDLCVNASAQSLNQILAAQKACIRGLPATPKRPALTLLIDRASVQNTVPLGGDFTMVWSFANTGATTLRSPIVTMQHDPSFEALELSRDVEYQPERQVGRWRLPDMPPNGRLEFSGRFKAVSPSAQASVTVQVETADGISGRQVLTLGVGNSGSGGDVLPGNPPAPIRSGFGANKVPTPSGNGSPPSGNGLERELSVTIIPVSNTVKKGEVGSYEIRVENLRNKPHQQVALRLQYPNSATLTSIRAKDLKYKLSNNDRQIDFEPIQYFRANDTYSCVVQLRLDQATEGELVASVTSTGQPTPSLNRLSIQAVPQ